MTNSGFAEPRHGSFCGNTTDMQARSRSGRQTVRYTDLHQSHEIRKCYEILVLCWVHLAGFRIRLTNALKSQESRLSRSAALFHASAPRCGEARARCRWELLENEMLENPTMAFSLFSESHRHVTFIGYALYSALGQNSHSRSIVHMKFWTSSQPPPPSRVDNIAHHFLATCSRMLLRAKFRL